jgi:hypothetical protein
MAVGCLVGLDDWGINRPSRRVLHSAPFGWFMESGNAAKPIPYLELPMDVEDPSEVCVGKWRCTAPRSNLSVQHAFPLGDIPSQAALYGGRNLFWRAVFLLICAP